MFGIVIVTHGAIGAEMAKALSMIVGKQEQVRAVSVGESDDMEASRAEVLAAIAAVDQGDGAILLTDMFGGTPSNLAISVMPETKTAVLAGVNLPTLIKLATLRNTMDLLPAAKEAENAGKKYIQLITENLATTVK